MKTLILVIFCMFAATAKANTCDYKAATIVAEKMVNSIAKTYGAKSYSTGPIFSTSLNTPQDFQYSYPFSFVGSDGYNNVGFVGIDANCNERESGWGTGNEKVVQ